MTNSTHTTPHTETNEQNETAHAAGSGSDDNRWVARFEDLLKVKNMDELKSELTKLAGEIQSEIQSFDLNAHLSPEAKSRLKTLEQRYGNVMRAIQKAQKQFDREFNKSIRVLMRTKQDAEKRLKNLTSKIAKHRGTLVKASSNFRNKLKKTTKKTVSRKSTKSATKKSSH